MRANEILTQEDLNQFKSELIEQLQELQSSKLQSKWLRSKDVRELLGISDSTLQTLRVGSIPSYKLGSSYYYKYEEIISAIEAGKVKGGKIDD